MKRRVLARVAAGGLASACCMLLACSLAVSTSGLSDGVQPSSEGGDGSVANAEAGLDSAASDADATLDAGRDPSLVAEFSFEDALGSASAHDTSGNEKNGVRTGDATFTDKGHKGHALLVLGSGSVVVEVLSGAAFPRTGTLSLWFQYSTPPADGITRGVFDNYATDRSHVFVRHANGSPADQFQMGLQSKDNAGQYAAVIEVTVQLSTWTHLVFTWDEGKREAVFYEDGLLLKRDAYDLPFAPDMQSFIMGAGLVGAIDEVRLYDRALPESEAVKLD